MPDAGEIMARAMAERRVAMPAKAFIDDAEAALSALEREGFVVVPAAAVEFIRWALQEGPWSGGDLDGGSVQDKAESLGVIVKTEYDPAKHGPSDFCAELGDDWFLLAPSLSAARPSQESGA